jgi:hypothetical protein
MTNNDNRGGGGRRLVDKLTSGAVFFFVFFFEIGRPDEIFVRSPELVETLPGKLLGNDNKKRRLASQPGLIFGNLK